MKKIILRILFILILLAIIGLYIFDIAVNKTPFTKNLFRTVSIVCICLLGFHRINYSAGRRNLAFYESHFADVIKNAFAGQFYRNKLLCAARLFDEGNYAKAIKYLGQLRPNCKTVDDHYAVLLLCALCFTEAQMYPEAVKVYRQMVTQKIADSRVFSNLGYVYSVMGNLENATSCYHEALYLDKNNAHTHVNIANIHFKAHEFEDAIVWADKALAINPNLYQASTLLAIIYAITDQTELAEKYKHMAIAAGQDSETLKNAIHHYKMEEQDTEPTQD